MDPNFVQEARGGEKNCKRRDREREEDKERKGKREEGEFIFRKVLIALFECAALLGNFKFSLELH